MATSRKDDWERIMEESRKEQERLDEEKKMFVSKINYTKFKQMKEEFQRTGVHSKDSFIEYTKPVTFNFGNDRRVVIFTEIGFGLAQGYYKDYVEPLGVDDEHQLPDEVLNRITIFHNNGNKIREEDLISDDEMYVITTGVRNMDDPKSVSNLLGPRKNEESEYVVEFGYENLKFGKGREIDVINLIRGMKTYYDITGLPPVYPTIKKNGKDMKIIFR